MVGAEEDNSWGCKQFGKIHPFAMLLLTIFFHHFSPNTTVLARVPHTDLYKDKGIYPTVQEVQGIKIFRIDASLYYANVEHFRKKLYKLTEGKF